MPFPASAPSSYAPEAPRQVAERTVRSVADVAGGAERSEHARRQLIEDQLPTSPEARSAASTPGAN
jgi:hypothetical protein